MSYRLVKHITLWGSILFVVLASFYGYQQWTIYKAYPRDIAAQLGLNEDQLINNYRTFNAIDVLGRHPTYLMIYNKDITVENLKGEVEKLNLNNLSYIETRKYTLDGVIFGGTLEVNGIILRDFYKSMHRMPNVYNWTGRSDKGDIRVSIYAIKDENDIYTIDGKIINGNIIIITRYLYQ